MIKLNTVYKAGKQEVKFQEKEPGIIYAEYGDEMVEGKMDGNTLKGIFQNKKVNVTGIMELSFHESGFEGRWKKGLEPGELKQKWNAILVESEEKNVASEFVKTGFHVFTDEDGVRYEGEWENDEFISGKAEYIDEDGVKVIEDGEFKDLIITSGKITYENGTIEEGTFDEEGVLHGQGKQTYLDEDGGQVIEEGNFDHSILKEGKITWADGNCASGVFDEELELNGKGIYTWPNRDFQDGTWVNGEFKDGKARITHEDGEISEGIMKDGEWVEEEQEEEAIVNIITNDIENYESGSKYEGEFLNGIRHGKGICTWANGDFQDGTWVHGEIKDGIAKETYASGNVYEGEWKESLPHGQGKMTFAHGDVYEGEWSEGSRHGQGKMTYADGGVYDGAFLNGIRYGKGRYTWESGNYYEGDFVDGDFNGEGTKNYINGDYKKGIWKDDKLINGEKKITSEDNEIEISLLENRLLQKQIITSKDIWDQEQISTTLFYYENGILSKKEEEETNSKGEVNIWIFNYKYDNDILIQEDILQINSRKEKYHCIENYIYEKGILTQKDSLRTFKDGGKSNYISKFTNGWQVSEKTITQDGSWKEEVFKNPSDKDNDLREVIINYSDERRFEGIYDYDNICYFEGELRFKNGDYKSGVWDENDELIEGEGKITYEGGDNYEGAFLNGSRHGKGRYTWVSGDCYDGEYKDGKRLGKTKFELENEQKQREEDERRYSEELENEQKQRERDDRQCREEKARRQREEDELERKKAQEKKEKQEKEEKINNTSHNFKIKVKHYWAPNGELACSKCGILIGRWKNGGSRGCKGSHNVLLSTEVCKKCGKSRKEIEYHPECKND